MAKSPRNFKMMKSKSFEIQTGKTNKNMSKSFDFVNLYRTAAETAALLAEKGSVSNVSIDKKQNYKKSKKEFNSECLNHSVTGNTNGSIKEATAHLTSTPLAKDKQQFSIKSVKSIIKNASISNNVSMFSESCNDEPSVADNKILKKRQKSVSFVLEDEDISVKKHKPNVSSSEKSDNVLKLKDSTSKRKNRKTSINIINKEKNSSAKTRDKKKIRDNSNEITLEVDNENFIKEKVNKKRRINKKNKRELNTENIGILTDNKNIQKKDKKRKRQYRSNIKPDETENEKNKPDITENLQNLNIGDNPHSLTNLLDEMSVADSKNKKRKNQQKTEKKLHKQNVDTADTTENNEKIKWKKRKWNKDKKSVIIDYETGIIVDNLPLPLIVDYRKLLSEHFSKYGLIKKIGPAEVYPAAEQKPVFTTSLYFTNEGAARQALSENNVAFKGTTLKVNRILSPMETTIVVRSYAELSEQTLSSAFLNCGRIRSIRPIQKGGKSIATAFVEFDGPKSVKKAIKLAENMKFDGKKVFVVKFEIRSKGGDKNVLKDGEKDKSKQSSSDEDNS